MPTNAERLRAIVDRAEPTPQSPGGLNLDLRVSLYADGHAAFGYADDSGNCINCKTDEQFTGRFRDLVREARRRQRRARPPHRASNPSRSARRSQDAPAGFLGRYPSRYPGS